MKLTCSECDKHEQFRVWDEQDGYATARLAGWVIGDGSTCPQCAAKAVMVQ